MIPIVLHTFDIQWWDKHRITAVDNLFKRGENRRYTMVTGP